MENTGKEFVMEYINFDQWPRKEHYDFFHKMDYPQFNVCLNIDITNLRAFAKEHHISFYYSMVFAATQAANQIENFRYRIRGERVVLHDKVQPSFTDISTDSDLFKYVAVNLTDDIISFAKKAKEQSEQQKAFFIYEDAEERDDLVYITCAPWFSFTQMMHPISLSKEDSVPRLSWGKYFQQDGKYLLPFSVQANHALLDGIHVGRFVEHLQASIDRL